MEDKNFEGVGGWGVGEGEKGGVWELPCGLLFAMPALFSIYCL